MVVVAGADGFVCFLVLFFLYGEMAVSGYYTSQVSQLSGGSRFQEVYAGCKLEVRPLIKVALCVAS